MKKRLCRCKMLKIFDKNDEQTIIDKFWNFES